MPEGDTLFRIAHTLAPVLVPKPLVALRSPLPGLVDAGLVGQRVEAVEARGKHLLITFEDGRVLHTHLRMEGSWHLYRPGEPWRKSERSLRVALAVEGAVAVCFSAPVVRLLARGSVPRDPMLSRLGPDVLRADFDAKDAIARLRATGLPLGEALLHQGAIAGLGNVYKSEVLFLERLDPWCSVRACDTATLEAMVARARHLIAMNVEEGLPRVPFRSPAAPYRFVGRTTRVVTGRGERRLWVYGRSGEPCFTCGALVRMQRQGPLGRSTYYCPRCQPKGPRAAGGDASEPDAGSSSPPRSPSSP